MSHDADATETGQGVVDEAFVPRYVDETDLETVAFEMGEPQVDRDAALLLFLPSIAIDAGKRLDQAGLAVVDVAGCADNHAPHTTTWTPTTG